MSVSLLLGLVYLISDSGLQKNLIRLQRVRSNDQAFKPGKQATVGEPLRASLLENDFHSFARELRTGEAPLT